MARDNIGLINKALTFHKDNPAVETLFTKYAMDLIHRGRGKFSHGTIIERIRWEALISTSNLDFKINQNFGAFYARLFEHKNPEHKGVFERRTSCFDTLYMAPVGVPDGHQ